MGQDPKKLLPSIFNRDFPESSMFRFPTFSDFEGLFKSDRMEQGLNVYEENSNFIVEAAVPGLEESEIDININKGVLWIKGEKKESETDKDKKYYRRWSSSFSYSIALPDEIDKDEPEASYNNGVLKVVFKKSKNAEAKRISIKSNKK